MSTETQKQAGGEVDGAGTQNSLTVTDNRTGETYELPSPTARSAPWTSARSRSPTTTSA